MDGGSGGGSGGDVDNGTVGGDLLLEGGNGASGDNGDSAGGYGGFCGIGMGEGAQSGDQFVCHRAITISDT